MTLYKLLKKYQEHGTIQDIPKLPRILSEEQLVFIDETMAEDDELTPRQLHALLLEKWPRLTVSLNTIKRARRNLGWVATRPKYCQIVRETNRIKRLEWCQEKLEERDDFHNVIFTDECSVQMDHHGRLCFRKKNQLRKLKPKPKHPLKVHIWGGISKKGATSLVIFKGTLISTK